MTLQTCIYCNSNGPFSDEHLFPAGLGGDDSRFLLRRLVCKICNELRFSQMEASFMRSSPSALARVFMQEHGRRRGSKISTPRLDTRMTAVLFDDGTIAEAEIQHRGEAYVLSQFVLHANGNVRFIGEEKGKPLTFIESLKNSLAAEPVFVIRKLSIPGGFQYAIDELSWGGNRYSMIGSRIVEKPPKTGIWLEPLKSNRGSDGHAVPRLFQKSTGQLVLRAGPENDIYSLLRQARWAAIDPKLSDGQNYRDVTNPVVQANFTLNMDHYQRTYAKIAMNLLIYFFGEHYARHFSFNRIKNGIVKGNPSVRMRHFGGDTFDTVPSDRHVISICSSKSRAGRYAIIGLIRLYGGKTTTVLLSTNAPKPIITDPVFMVVHYNSHQIELMGVTQFAEKYKRSDFPQDFQDEIVQAYIHRFWPDVLPQTRLRRCVSDSARREG